MQCGLGVMLINRNAAIHASHGTKTVDEAGNVLPPWKEISTSQRDRSWEQNNGFCLNIKNSRLHHPNHASKTSIRQNGVAKRLGKEAKSVKLWKITQLVQITTATFSVIQAPHFH